MPEKLRRPTKQGMGAVRIEGDDRVESLGDSVLESGIVPRSKTESPPSTGVACPAPTPSSPLPVNDGERRAMATRDTVLALEAQGPASQQGLRRQTLAVETVSTRDRPLPRSEPPDVPLRAKPKIRSSVNVAQAPLDAREAFLLSLIDGATTVQDLLDAAAMPRAEVISTLHRLVRLGLIEL